MRQTKALAIGGIIFWLACSSPAMYAVREGKLVGLAAAAWAAAFLLFGSALIYDSPLRPEGEHSRRSRLIAFWLLLASGFGMVWFSTAAVKYISSVSLVLAALRLPQLTSARNAYVGAIAIELVLLVTLALQDTWGAVLGNGGALAGSLLFAVTFSVQSQREMAARKDLALANAELVATREQLAQTSRTEERLRIARDLHDTLGHHLTALSIQLDVAARRSDNAAAEHIREAHAIARLLLSDVRDVVGELRSGGEVNVTALIKPLCRTYGDLHVYLESPDSILAGNAAQAEVLLRCVQEIVTNTLKHAQAHNLWIRVTQSEFGIDIHARDDGRGSTQIRDGHGLAGMRERFAALGGRVEISSTPGAEFIVHVFMPFGDANA